MVDSSREASSLGIAGCSGSAQRPVKLHHAHSSMNVFPSPLSPVMMLRRSPGLNVSDELGPTPRSSKDRSVPPSSGMASGGGSIIRNRRSSEYDSSLRRGSLISP